ncbi:hypothetical protein JW935_16275 [candidate division KSB1 bacterium]|nr:hypothetical protein [candidate division KSB1 bacterium]
MERDITIICAKKGGIESHPTAETYLEYKIGVSCKYYGGTEDNDYSSDYPEPNPKKGRHWQTYYFELID